MKANKWNSQKPQTATLDKLTLAFSKIEVNPSYHTPLSLSIWLKFNDSGQTSEGNVLDIIDGLLGSIIENCLISPRPFFFFFNTNALKEDMRKK